MILRPSRPLLHQALPACAPILSLILLVLGTCPGASAQQPGPGATSLPDAPVAQTQAEDQSAVTLRNVPRHIVHDQEAIWTSPARMRAHDLVWLAPLAGAEAAAIATDHRAMESVVSHDASFNQDNVNASNVLVGGYIALPVALFGYGQWKQDEHAREAGILGGEAIIDGLVVEQGLKLVFWRERPALDNARGRFWQSGAGIDSSFPSSHAVLTWAAAGALVGEYRKPWQQAGLYTFASAVSLTRVLGQQHFPGDIVAGSAAGWLLGHYLFRRYQTRHAHELH